MPGPCPLAPLCIHARIKLIAASVELCDGELDAWGGDDVSGAALVWDGEVLAEEGVEEGLAPEPGLIGGAGGYKDADAEGVDAPAPDEFCTPQPAISAEAINAMMTIPGVLFMLPP